MGVKGISVWVGLGHLSKMVFICDASLEVEAPQELHKPLVYKDVRHQYEGSVDALSHEKSVENEAGFDGFSKAHLVGQEHPGEMA